MTESRWRSFLRRLLPHKYTGPQTEEVRALSEQFYITLRAQLAAIERKGAQTQSDAYKRVKAILDQEREQWTWSGAYDVEQNLVNLFDDDMLDAELGRRLVEARFVLRPATAGWYAEESKKPKSTEAKHDLLLRLVNDLQWRYTVNEVIRGYSKQISRRTGWIFASSILIFVVVMIAADLPCFQYSEPFSMSLAAAAGFWGAAFSMLTGLKTRIEASELEDLKLARHMALLLARTLVGVGAALILYFFMRSGLLSGEALPGLDRYHLDTVMGTCPGVPWKTLALLTVWCFLAGFSEKLVPSLLAKTEGRMSEPPQQKPPEPRAAVPAPGSETPAPGG